MEKFGYFLLIVFYALAINFSLSEVEVFYPDGLLILLFASGLLMLFVKVLNERINNKEDNYYSKEIENKSISQVLGVVSGQSIRARHLGKDILAGLRNVVGGEITEYSKLMAESRQQAMDRMIYRAEELNADAIVGVRFTTSMLQAGASEIFIYGTAVKL